MTCKETPLLPYCFFDGKIVPNQEAKLSISSQSIQYGLTCFAGLRGFYRDHKHHIVRLKDHHQRLINGTKILGMEVDCSFKAFQKVLEELFEKNKPDHDVYIRPFFYTNDDYVGPRFDRAPYQLAIYMQKLSHYMDPSKGLKLMVSSFRKYSDQAISVKAKAGGVYLNSALATTEARNNGYDDALLFDQQDYLSEASLANVLIAYRGELYSPQTGMGALDGWTLRTALTFLEDQGYTVRREVIDRSMVYSSDELILTGTAAQVLYASSVDQRQIGQGEEGFFCKLLRKEFKALIQGTHARSKEWLTSF